MVETAPTDRDQDLVKRRQRPDLDHVRRFGNKLQVVVFFTLSLLLNQTTLPDIVNH